VRTWADVGLELPYGTTGEVRTTCPQCSPSRRKSRVACMAVNADTGTWLCHHCGWKGGLHGRLQASVLPPRPRPPVQPDARKRAALRRVWSEASPLTAGDPVVTYLSQRGIELPQSDLPTALRCHRHLAYRHDDGQTTYHPAMVARVDDVHGQGVSIHRTYLTSDGHKAAVPTVKKLMSPATPGTTVGGAIRLSPAGETLAVAEGIETALSVHRVTRLPTWATLCADGMTSLIVHSEVRLVVICADHDPAGLHAAHTLARCLLAQQRRVKILTPDIPGADWADVLAQEVHHAG
jgi:putative DNA primase/helicase